MTCVLFLCGQNKYINRQREREIINASRFTKTVTIASFSFSCRSSESKVNWLLTKRRIQAHSVTAIDSLLYLGGFSLPVLLSIV